MSDASQFRCVPSSNAALLKLTSVNYTFFSPQQMLFGWGRRSELPRLAAAWGTRVFLISGSRTLERLGLIGAVENSLHQSGLSVVRYTAPAHEPEVDDVDSLTRELLWQQPTAADVVIAIGGGSTIDLAKAVAAMVTNSSKLGDAIAGTRSSPTAGVGVSVVDFLEGVGRGLKIERPPLPLIAVPTTAGTGTEATKNAVISSFDPPFKKSLRSDLMIPRCVVIDPEFTVSLPATMTAYTGMDAITQLLESFLSNRAAPIPQALCEQGLELALPSIRRVVVDGSDRSAREAMAHAALLSGLALANSGLGLAHGVAAALGVQCRVPHGLACAVMLPPTLEFNRPVCQAALARLAHRVLPGMPKNDAAAAEALIAEIRTLCRDVNIPSQLRSLGVRQEQIPALVAGSQGNSLSGNPRRVSDIELYNLLEALW